MNKIGQRIKMVRKILNKSQMTLANDLSISKQAISNIENSKSMPSVPILCKLLIDFNVNVNYLLTGEGEMFVNSDLKEISLKDTILHEIEKYLDNRGIA